MMTTAMSKYKILMLSLIFGTLWGCGPKDTDKEQESLKAQLKDTATAASAPLMEDTDTVMQKVAELELHALGNTLDEIRYSKDTLEVKAGEHIKFTFVNEGVDMPMVHNVVFTAPGKYKEVALAGDSIGASGNYIPQSDDVIAATPIALPGQTVELEFMAPTKPGLYDFVCTYPDHWQKMNGVLVVK
ncbi:plastocyanin/azurin family copper-binding protein [Pontibacter mangrovi]|uniref:Azurin n=1 Tax=Pontibacter mangrovi TaxID=2589816 RepID=A0A501W8G8_9BACT|nr:plastocyanin/azurin family copper-binding protein [Pontibacter mangrovi]TPE45909.1 azurin [Pontibacter mangrovi]